MRVILLVLFIALALLIAQNTTPFQVRFLWLTTEMPGIILLFLTALGGFGAGLLVALLAKNGASS